MKITKSKLKEIIKEEINKLQTEQMKDKLSIKKHLKPGSKIHSSIPFLAVKKAIERLDQEIQVPLRLLASEANPMNRIPNDQLIRAIENELKNDSSIRRAIGDDDLRLHLKVPDLVRDMAKFGELKPLKPL